MKCASSARRKSRAMATSSALSVVTANVTSYGPMLDWLGGLQPMRILAIQEHHIVEEQLGAVQNRARDLGRKVSGHQLLPT